jgi:hypothetical protein
MRRRTQGLDADRIIGQKARPAQGHPVQAQ